ncbi:DMT family transporter [Salinibius halmophilus]|uniref:DMT family transporter n=1 Tax=Salinibius halmophilus TaxID=1853216 RepID=UPI000E65FD64|nr:DMT family transporter [Salinibius halmophilus]
MRSAVVAFFIVVIVWSTTPLAINWSVADGSSQFAAWLRMAIGFLLSYASLKALRLPLVLTRAAIIKYMAGSLGIYGTMTCVYVASHAVSSGLVAVIHGLIPMLAAALSWPILSQRTSKFGIAGLFIASLGLAFVFASELQVSPKQAPWILLIVFGVSLQALGAVLIKKLASTPLHPMQQLTGTLLVVVIGFSFNTSLAGQWQGELGTRAILATLYLAAIGSVVGFYAYFTALQHLSAVQVGMITLISPVFAVILGNTLNGESMPTFTLLGSIIIGIGLATYLARAVFTRGATHANRPKRG